VQVPLVVTHKDSPTENAWFGSVADLANKHGIEVAKPADPNSEGFIRRVAIWRRTTFSRFIIARS